ncbi:MAG: hypothetical protein GOVbin1578_33 [Prokaryotic dsDNA virus sp.]|nr:MAG: hypothetical protein GOVbin1578_33 [Prokaryotic dsDNA virus sp.]
MAKRYSVSIPYEPAAGVRGKKTSIGRRNVGTSTMNKNKKRLNKKKYRGQGR